MYKVYLLLRRRKAIKGWKRNTTIICMIIFGGVLITKNSKRVFLGAHALSCNYNLTNIFQLESNFGKFFS